MKTQNPTKMTNRVLWFMIGVITLLLAFLLLLILVPDDMFNHYQKGAERGYDLGYSKGFDDGFEFYPQTPIQCIKEECLFQVSYNQTQFP